jgi:type I restriction enzyme S subunit
MKQKTIKEIANIKTGKHDANHSSINGKYTFFTCALNPLKADTYSFDGELIILPGNGANLGEVLYYNGKAEAYQRTYILHDLVCHGKYLYYYLKKTWKEHIIKRQIGSATNYMKLEDIANLKVPLPPIEIQKRIAAVLDKAKSLIDIRREQIAKLEELLKSLFLEMFGDPLLNPKGWKMGRIKDIVSRVNYGTSQKANDKEGRYPVLRMSNITYNGNMDISNIKYIDLKNSDLDKYLVKKGDLLFNRTNSKELVGKTAIYTYNEPMAYAGYLIRVRTNELAVPEYLSGFLNSNHGKLLLRNMCKAIIGMANINAKEMQNISIMIPPIELQNKYAQVVKATNERKQVLEKGFLEMETLFQSILQKAFQGELFQ